MVLPFSALVNDLYPSGQIFDGNFQAQPLYYPCLPNSDYQINIQTYPAFNVNTNFNFMPHIHVVPVTSTVNLPLSSGMIWLSDTHLEHDSYLTNLAIRSVPYAFRVLRLPNNGLLIPFPDEVVSIIYTMLGLANTASAWNIPLVSQLQPWDTYRRSIANNLVLGHAFQIPIVSTALSAST